MVNFEQIYSVSKEIYEAVQQAKENKKQCESLYERVQALVKAVKGLEERNDRGKEESTEATLERMLNILRECRTFVLEFSKSRNAVMKLVQAKGYQKELAELDNALSKGAIDLTLALSSQNAIDSSVSKKRGSIFIKPTDKKEDQERTVYVLDRLEKLFAEERYWNEKTDNYDTYNQCLKEVHPELALIYKYGKENKHVLELNKKELTRDEAVSEIHRAVTLAISKPFLRLIVEGEQDKAEAMLKSNAALALVPGDITDLSKRTFTNITGFQYAVWALDWHMWTMIKKYLPDEAAREQVKGFETGSWVKSCGVHVDLGMLIQAYETTTDLYNSSKAAGDTAWVRQVGGAQLLLPAHVINEYCHPTRSFRPLPNFKNAAALPRTRLLAEGDWTRAYSGLGERNAIVRMDLPRANARQCASSFVVGSDVAAIRALSSTRTAQREELIAELRPKNVRRF